MHDDTRPCAHCGDEFQPTGRPGYSQRGTYCGRCCSEYATYRKSGLINEWHAKRSRLCACGNPVAKGYAKYCGQVCSKAQQQTAVPRRAYTCAVPSCHNLCLSSHRKALFCSNRCKGVGQNIRRGGLHAVITHPHWVLSQPVHGPTMGWLKVLPLLGPSLTDWPLIGPIMPPTAHRRAVTDKKCESCGVSFVGTTAKRFCSERCFRSPIDDACPATCGLECGHCRRCGSPYARPARPNPSGCCSAACTKRLIKSIERRRNRSRRHNQVHEPYTLREIAERDGWRCHLCGHKVPDRTYTSHDKDPTIDHLVPQSAGGDDVKSNVALAHNRCNWERGAGGVAQLRLTG